MGIFPHSVNMEEREGTLSPPAITAKTGLEGCGHQRLSH